MDRVVTRAHIVQTDRATLVALSVAPLFEGSSWQRIDDVLRSLSRSHVTDGRGQRQQALVGCVEVLVPLWNDKIRRRASQYGRLEQPTYNKVTSIPSRVPTEKCTLSRTTSHHPLCPIKNGTTY
jgi:hypothetical protein